MGMRANWVVARLSRPSGRSVSHPRSRRDHHHLGRMAGIHHHLSLTSRTAGPRSSLSTLHSSIVSTSILYPSLSESRRSRSADGVQQPGTARLWLHGSISTAQPSFLLWLSPVDDGWTVGGRCATRITNTCRSTFLPKNIVDYSALIQRSRYAALSLFLVLAVYPAQTTTSSFVYGLVLLRSPTRILGIRRVFLENLLSYRAANS